MSIVTQSLKNLLLPGLLEVSGEYDQVQSEWEGVYTTKTSSMQLERTVQMRFTSPARVKTEGGATYMDNESGERAQYNLEPIEASIGYSFTRKAIDDNLYKDAFRPANLGLQQSMRAFWNAMAAAVFNTASTYNPNIGGDGVSLLNTAHPNDAAPWANTSSTPRSLNEASLIAAIKGVASNFVDEAGILQHIDTEQLVIPINLIDTAIRLTQAELRPGTAQNDPNVINNKDMFGGIRGFKVMRYLTSAYPWFLTTSVKGLIHLDRVPFEMDMQVEFNTDNLLVKSYQRGGFFYDDPRSLWGEMATS